MKRYVVGITGASGVIYGKRLVEILLEAGYDVFLMVTDPAREVFKQELGKIGRAHV